MSAKDSTRGIPTIASTKGLPTIDSTQGMQAIDSTQGMQAIDSIKAMRAQYLERAEQMKKSLAKGNKIVQSSGPTASKEDQK